MAHDELDVASVVDHPNITKIIGVVRESDQQWLVMERAPGKPLADKPDFSSVLRCRWGPGKRFEPVLVLAVLLQVRYSSEKRKEAFMIGKGSGVRGGTGAGHAVCSRR